MEQDLRYAIKLLNDIERMSESMGINSNREKIQKMTEYSLERDNFIQPSTNISFSDAQQFINIEDRIAFTIDVESTHIMDDAVSYKYNADTNVTEIGFHSPFIDVDEIPKFNEFIEIAMKEPFFDTDYDYEMDISGAKTNKTLIKGKQHQCVSLLIYIDKDGRIIKKWYGLTLVYIYGNLYYPRISKKEKQLTIKQFVKTCSNSNNWVIEGTSKTIMKKQVTNFCNSILQLMQSNNLMFKYHRKETVESELIGDIIKHTGYILAESVGKDLYNIYGEYSFVNLYYNKKCVYSKIRSPLRKFGDVLGSYQLMAVMLKKNELEMMKYVTNREDITKEQFKNIILFINRDKYPFSDKPNE